MSAMADTAIWIKHFRQPNADLLALINANELGMHPAILGELVVGNLPSRSITIAKFYGFPSVVEVPSRDVVLFIERNQFFGKD